MALVVLLILSLHLFVDAATNSRRGIGGSATKGEDIFLKSRYFEVAINPGSVFGSREVNSELPYSGTPAPPSFHPTLESRQMSLIIDYDKNGFDIGVPSKSADLFLEGYDEIGFHLSWTGSTKQVFNQMPLVDNNEELDTDFFPPRGCRDCVQGLNPSCDPQFEDCSCGPNMPDTYFCPFKVWNLVTDKFLQVNYAGDWYDLQFEGRAIGTEFIPSDSGYLESIGEEITVKRNIAIHRTEMIITETTSLMNSGNRTLYDIGFMWHAAPTPEAMEHPKMFNDDRDYQAWSSIPFQGSATNEKVLVKSRGNFYNITYGIGTLDKFARAWILDYDLWLDSSRSPYSADLIFKDIVDRLPRGSSTETFGTHTIAIGTKYPMLSKGQSVTLKAFHILDGSEETINKGFQYLSEIGCDGFAGRYDSCGVCKGSCPKGQCDLCGVCNGNNVNCTKGCDGVFSLPPATYDVCGVCGGNSSCLGCDGRLYFPPNQAKKYDECGVCGGFGRTCGPIRWVCNATCMDTCVEVLDYTAEDLDHLIYLHEVSSISLPKLGSLSDTMENQLARIRFSDLKTELDEYINSFNEFGECVCSLVEDLNSLGFGFNNFCL